MCKTPYALRVHMLVHSEPQIPCEYPGCKRMFRQVSNMRTHMLVHTKIKRFACTVEGCPDRFAHRTSLDIHLRWHAQEWPYKCTYPGCDATFAQSAHLTVHVRSKHTLERPYRCTHDGCDAAFPQSSHLKEHLHWHSGYKPHRCPFENCPAAFTQSCNLNTHVRVFHMGIKDHVCSECGAAYGYKNNLQKHVEAMHTLEGQARRKNKEERVAKVLAAAGLAFKREHVIDFTCVGDVDGAYARVDFVLHEDGRIIFLEVDEGQHRFGYGKVACDMKRMAKIIESLGLEGNTLPIVFLRYNPDAFTVDGHTSKVSRKAREARLVATLTCKEDSKSRAAVPLTIRYMFYDTVEGQACVVSDPDYHVQIAACCVHAITSP